MTKDEKQKIDRDRKKVSYHTDTEQKERHKARCLARYHEKKREVELHG